MVLKGFVLLSALILVINAQDCSYYINQTGNDTTGSGNSTHPWQTLDRAFKQVDINKGANVVCTQNGWYMPQIANVPSDVIVIGYGSIFTLVLNMGNNKVIFYNTTFEALTTTSTGNSSMLSISDGVIFRAEIVVTNYQSTKNLYKYGGNAGDFVSIIADNVNFVQDYAFGYLSSDKIAPIMITGTTINISNSSFNDNIGGNSGAIYLNITGENAVGIFSNVSFHNNRASGGSNQLPTSSAILIFQSAESVSKLNITDCTADCLNQPAFAVWPPSLSTYFTIEGKSNTSGCDVTCTAGQFSKYKLLQCLPCLPGFYNNVTNMTVEECQHCAVGEVSSGNAVNCTYCGPGHFANNSVVCTQCYPGSYSKGGSDECTLCEINTYQPELAKDLCEPCPTLQYTSQEGSYDCSGLTVQSWAFVAVAVFFVIVVIAFWTGYRIYTNRKAQYQPIE